MLNYSIKDNRNKEVGKKKQCSVILRIWQRYSGVYTLEETIAKIQIVKKNPVAHENYLNKRRLLKMKIFFR